MTGLQEAYLAIEFTNSGKSEITKIKFSLIKNVSMFESDIIDYVAPKLYTWEKNIQVELGEKDTILLPITNSRYFPQFTGNVENLSFVDIRGNKFTDYDGSSTFGKTNGTLRPIQPTEDELNSLAEPEPSLELEPVPSPESKPRHRRIIQPLFDDPNTDDDEDNIPF